MSFVFFFFFQAEDGIRDLTVTGVQTCALPISALDGPMTNLEASSASGITGAGSGRSEEHTSELQSQSNLVCRLLLEKKKAVRTERSNDLPPLECSPPFAVPGTHHATQTTGYET